VGEVTRRGRLALMRLSPERYWLIEDAPRDLANSGPDFGGLHVVDLTEGRVRLRLSGARCRAVLAKCVAVDWEAPETAAERAVATMLPRVPVVIHRLQTDAFDLLAPRSFGQSLREWLDDAGREFIDSIWN